MEFKERVRVLGGFRKWFIISMIGCCSFIFSSCTAKDRPSVEEIPLVSVSENILSTGNVASSPNSSAENIANDVIKSCDQIQGSKTMDTIQGNLIDLTKAKVGDKILGLTIAEITNKIQGVTDEKAQSVRFCGNMKLSGTFVYHKNHEFFSNAISFIPNQESKQKLPTLNTDQKNREITIILQNIPSEIVGELGDYEVKGTAVFEVENYTIRRAATEIWDTAEVLDISDIDVHVAATLPDGTQLFENQSPVEWKDMLVQIVNNGSGHTEKSNLRSDVSSQIAYGTGGSGVEVFRQEELIVNSKSYTLAFAKQNGENKYVLLEYVSHLTEKDVAMIYSVVVTTTENPEAVMSFLADLTKTWTHSDQLSVK